ncbi:methyltransferase domain-containing protein [bacterium]|nr:methyltransferase domain-containing protein [bacterium]
MSYDGYTGPPLSEEEKHLGGNIKQGDPYTYCPNIWNYVIERFCIKSVLDVGSGRGFSAQYFYKHGCQVVAVEGVKENCQTALYPTIHHDLTKGPIYAKVDLVHCHEMVEHLEEK